MYRPMLATILVSTGLLAGSAWAQTTPPTAAGGAFVTAQQTGEFRASKFVGVDIYGSEGEKIGDISEILLDGQGNAKAVVIGVGGFLGMGQKNVAVPWSAVTWSNEPAASRSAAADRPAAAGGSTRPSTPGGTAGGAPPAPAPTRSPAEQAAYNGYPDHGKVTLTKTQLQEAPDFKYVSDAPSSAPKN